jgi:hypothetical protein
VCQRAHRARVHLRIRRCSGSSRHTRWSDRSDSTLARRLSGAMSADTMRQAGRSKSAAQSGGTKCIFCAACIASTARRASSDADPVTTKTEALAHFMHVSNQLIVRAQRSLVNANAGVCFPVLARVCVATVPRNGISYHFRSAAPGWSVQSCLAGSVRAVVRVAPSPPRATPCSPGPATHDPHRCARLAPISCAIFC